VRSLGRCEGILKKKFLFFINERAGVLAEKLLNFQGFAANHARFIIRKIFIFCR